MSTNLQQTLDRLLLSFKKYYTISTEYVMPPFKAEAIFQSHSEQYFLVKSARLSEAVSNEFAYFYTTKQLTLQELEKLDKCAWERGISHVQPNYYHKNTDVALIILADYIDEDAKKSIPKMKHSKSYKFGFNGYSNYRLIAIELSTKQTFYNYSGKSLKKLINNISMS